MVEYGVNFGTSQPLNAQALDLLHNSLTRMQKAEKEESNVSEWELSASSSETSKDEAMIPTTFPHSVQHQMPPAEGVVLGSAATENPCNSLTSLLASFASGHSDEEDKDDNSRLPTEGSQEEEAPPQRVWGLTPLLVLESRRPHRSQLEGSQPLRLVRQKYPRKGPLQ